MKENLPESKHEMWDGDNSQVDLFKSESLMCKNHKLIVDIPMREAYCEVCHYGFRFHIHESEITQESFTDKRNNRKLNATISKIIS